MTLDDEISEVLESLVPNEPDVQCVVLSDDLLGLCRHAERLAISVRSQLELDPQLHAMADALFEKVEAVRQSKEVG